MKTVVGVLVGFVLSVAAYAQDYTDAERQAANEQAESELIRAEIVDINRDLIRVRTITKDEDGKRKFVSDSMSDMTQCGAFRIAQANMLEAEKPEGGAAFRERGAYFEMHLLLLARAASLVLGEPGLEGNIKSELSKKGADWVKQHFEAMSYKTAGQKEHVDYWSERCDQMEEMLNRQLERRARNQVTPSAIKERANELLAENKANP